MNARAHLVARLHRRAVPLLLAVLLGLLADHVLAQGPAWATEAGDDRFAGPHAVVRMEPAAGTEAGELRVGCDAASPKVVLSAERELGAGKRELYLRVVGLREASTYEGTVGGASLELAGFDAVLFLTDVLAPEAARAMFVRLPGEDGSAWSVPLAGLRDALAGLPCAGPLL